MKATKTADAMALIGAGAGLVVLAAIGLLTGSMLGGVMGLNIAGGLFGTPVTSALLPRVIVALSMLVGVLAAGVVCVAGGAAAGWVLGYVAEALHIVPARMKAEKA